MAKSPLFVVPVDFAPEMEATVSAAIGLARQWDARVHLLEVVPPSRLLDDKATFRRSSRTTSKGDWSRLEDAIRVAERAQIDVRMVAYRGDATKVIASYAQLAQARLLVIDQNYGTSRLRRSTRIVSTLSRSAPAPVLVLPPRRRSENTQPLSFAHIVSAVDFTVASAVALRTVLSLIRRRAGARLTLVHALKQAFQPMAFSGGEGVRVARNLRGNAASTAKQFRRKIPVDVALRVETRVTTGDPDRGILDTASDVKADLIVMGVPPRTRFDEMLSGSTLRSVLRRTKIPVLVLPVPAGANEWLEEADAIVAVSATRNAGKPKRLAQRS